MTAIQRHVRGTRLLAWLAWAALLLWSAAASGQPGPADPAEATAAAASESDAKERAMALKRDGDAAMVALRYQEALAKYTEAYQHDPSPALLYNRGRAYQALGQFPESLEQLEQFERDAPAALKARVPKLKELISEVRGRVSTLKVTANIRGAQVLLNDHVIGKTPLGPLRVNAGDAAIQVLAEGYVTAEKRLVLRGGHAHELTLELLSRANTAVLVVRSPVAGATVHVDGKLLGTVPAEATVAAGTRKIQVSHPGYDDAETQVVLQPGGRKTIDVDLDKGIPFYESWWFWTGAAAVAATAVIISIAAVTEGPNTEGDIEPGVISAPLLRF